MKRNHTLFTMLTLSVLILFAGLMLADAERTGDSSSAETTGSATKAAPVTDGHKLPATTKKIPAREHFVLVGPVQPKAVASTPLTFSDGNAGESGAPLPEGVLIPMEPALNSQGPDKPFSLKWDPSIPVNPKGV